MKKKFLSTLLMGAFIIASVSLFTSCKDYDDDINKINTELASLKSSLDKRVSDLEAAKAECVANLEKLTGRVGTLETQMGTKWGETEVKNAIAAALEGYVTKAQLEEATKDFLTADQIKALDDEILKLAKEYVDAEAAKHAEAAKIAAIEEAKKYADELIAGLADKYVDVATYAAKMQELDGKIAGIDEKLAKLDKLDIDAITATIAAVENMKTQIAALESFKAAMEAKTLVELNDLETLKNTLQGQISDLETKLEGEYKKAIEEAVQGLRDEIAKQGGIKPYDDTELRDKITDLEAKFADLSKEDVAQLKEMMQYANKEVIEGLSKGMANLNVLQLFIEKKVTSIVLKPEYYYAGIEAIELPALYDKAYTVKTPLRVQRNGDVVDWDKTETWTQNKTNDIDVCKGGIAYYHVNPYSADWVGGTIEFLGNIAQTRAAGNPEQNYENIIEPVNRTLTEDNAVEGYAGLIKVPFKGSFDNINTLLKGNNLPMVALHFTKEADDKKVDVSSDWALVAPTQYMNLIIANNPVVTKYYTKTPHEGFNFGQAVDAEIATLGLMKFDGKGKEIKEQRVNPTTGHFTRLIENITADSIPGTYQIKYDETFNLTKAVETHYTYKYRTSAGTEVVETADKVMSNDMFKNFGLRYEFEIVEYNSGTNNTEESKHIWVEKNEEGDYIAIPCQVTAEGDRIFDENNKIVPAGRASVGRMPLIRVSIMNEANQTVSYAYIKLEIVEGTTPPPPPLDPVEFKFDDKIYVDCGMNGYSAALTWSQIENIILIEALGNNYSKDTFEDKWTLKGYDMVIADVEDGTTGEADQYFKADEKTKKPYTDTDKKVYEKMGKVQLVQDPKAVNMQVLQWTLSATDIFNTFMLKDKNGRVIEDPMQVDPDKVDTKTGLSKIPLETYVLLDGPTDVWVKFIIPAGAFQFAVGGINDNKTKAYWFKLNTKEQGLKETHANVVVPNTQNDDCAFEWDLLAAFDEYTVGGAIRTDLQGKFPSFDKQPVTFTFTTPTSAKPIENAAFNADKNGQWTVTGNSGVNYTVKVGDNSDCVVAIKKGDTNIPEPYDTICAFKEEGSSLIVYKDNETAKDILNYAGHLQLGSKQTFTAYLKMTIASCYEMIIPDGSDYINVRFLRPVDVNPTKDAEMQDAKDGGDDINVMSLVDLVDWRGISFKSVDGLTDKMTSGTTGSGGTAQDWNANFNGWDGVKAQEGPHYVNYYGVEIEADVENARTDINLEEAARNKELDKAADIEKLVLLKKNSPKAIFTYTHAPITWNAKDKKFEGGMLHYENNSGNVQKYHVYVPLTITYKWGTKMNVGYGMITVKKTLGQGGSAKKF